MSQRIRTYKKIGKGRYYTSSHSVSEYFLGNIIYFIFILIPYYLIKYAFMISIYIPVKFIYNKIKSKINQKNDEKE